MIVVRILIDLLFAVGIFFTIAGIVGMIRMPDTYCRLQSSTNIATMGALPIALGCAIYGFAIGNSSLGIKALVIMFFLIITNPVASHAMTRAAYKTKAKLFEKNKCDHYGRDEEDQKFCYIKYNYYPWNDYCSCIPFIY